MFLLCLKSLMFLYDFVRWNKTFTTAYKALGFHTSTSSAFAPQTILAFSVILMSWFFFLKTIGFTASFMYMIISSSHPIRLHFVIKCSFLMEVFFGSIDQVRSLLFPWAVLILHIIYSSRNWKMVIMSYFLWCMA